MSAAKISPSARRPEKETDRMSHRDVMGRRRVLAVLGAAAVAPAALAGCGGGELTCQQTAGLSADQIQLRQQQHYVDRSPHQDRKCDGCRFYQRPERDGTCGGCQVVAGPIHPDGYCDLFAATT
jgi:hypothetical protein